jgi:hypothetical protein
LHSLLCGLWLGHGDTSGTGCRCGIFKRLRIGGILKRGELRIGLEVGYMPFEMIDKRSGLRQKEIRHGGPDARGVNSA